MAITSLSYLLFLVAAVTVYYIIPKKFRWPVLLVASIYYYFCCSGALITFIALTSLSVWGVGMWLQKSVEAGAAAVKAAGPEKRARVKSVCIRKKRLIFMIPFVLNLFILIFFKYEGVFELMIAPLTKLVTGQRVSFNEIAIPVGLSFYTFQAISYLLDIYRNQLKAERNPLKVLTFLMFFPQVIQGPISRYKQLAPQLFEGHRLSFDNLEKGIIMIGWGFMKKLLFADRLSMLVEPVFTQPEAYGGAMLFLASAAYGMQVYADFSGGMNIIFGAARMFGIEMPENFHQPYYAISLSNHWQRWHMTLGSWMRDYVFYPLSLSKPFSRLSKFCRKHFGARWAKVIISALSSFVVFTLVGIWHGASLKYVVFGLYNGGVIMLATMMEPVFEKWFKKTGINPDSGWWHIVRMVRTFFIVTCGHTIAHSANVMSCLRAFRKMLTQPQFGQLTQFRTVAGWEKLDLAIVLGMLALVAVVDWIAEHRESPLDWLKKRPIVIRWMIYLSIIAALTVLIPTVEFTGGFIYAKF